MKKIFIILLVIIVPAVAGIFGMKFDFGTTIALQQLPTYLIINKFGENPDIDKTSGPEDIWEAGSNYIYDPTNTAPIVSLISISNGDTEPITVEGLSSNGTLTVQTITLTGTNRVALTTPLWRVFRMYNVGTNDLAGTVYCYVGTNGGTPATTNTRATIDDGNNQTLMALYTVPAGYVGLLYYYKLGMSRSLTSGNAQIVPQIREYGSVFRVNGRNDLSFTGSSDSVTELPFPIVVAGMSDIKFSVESVSANNTGVGCRFAVALIPESEYSDNYLSSINQPGY